MHEYIIAREDEECTGFKTQFWGKKEGLMEWLRSKDDIIRWSDPAQAVINAKALGIKCYVMENYGSVRQLIHEFVTPTVKVLVNKETVELRQRIKEANIIAENGEEVFLAGVEHNDYAYKDIEEYEKYFGGKVNEAFKMGWTMARATNEMLGIKEDEEDVDKD